MRWLAALAFVLPVLADTGNAVCAKCHGDIARHYARTAMAQTSGRTGQPGSTEKFAHPNVAPGFVLQSGSASRKLEWFLGSGHIGRSYLFRKGGQLFQAPYSYYSEPQHWDVSPGYESKSYPEWTRAVEPGCLQCHASRLQPLSAPQPFLEAGVSCERCHGPGERHAANPSARNIVQPAKLPAEQRDSVCAQCHLTGVARVAKAGRERGSFVPGEKLSGHLAIFVQTGAGLSATSHFEKLAASSCKQGSGDKLWCGTCHSPHADASAESYNKKCQSCHAAGNCKANAGGACITCHMPKQATGRTIQHLAFTDHSIPRKRSGPEPERQSVAIKEYWPGTASPRDTALAYAVAAAAEPDFQAEAYARLQKAAAALPTDVPILAQLAQFHERAGEDAKAEAVYRQILTLDPGHAVAAMNLGTARIKQGQPKEAMALWLQALTRNPALIGARLNLAVAQYQSGDAASARKSLLAVLDYEPEHPIARKMLDQLP